MKFFDCKTAPSPRRVRIFIAEKGITVETVDVDLRSKEQLNNYLSYQLASLMGLVAPRTELVRVLE